MSVAHRTWWAVAVASAACAAGLVPTGAGAGDGTRGHAPAADVSVPPGTVPEPRSPGSTGAPAEPAAVRPGTASAAPGGPGPVPGGGSPAPSGASPAPGASSPAPGGPSSAPGATRPAPVTEPPGRGAPYAGRARVFGLVEAGATPGTVRFAPARRAQPGGPETVHPVDVGPYVTLPLAPGAVIRASAPIVDDGVTDWVHGIRLTPGAFWSAMRRLKARSHPFRERSHMFELWFDREGRITRLQHYFSP